LFWLIYFILFFLKFRNIGILSRSYNVYAIDLLGFGGSDKPAGFAYNMESWAQVRLHFHNWSSILPANFSLHHLIASNRVLLLNS
jgi:pimeloyl-ACP methyl ester carboxylesterase